jgi:hypothetical protein
MAEGGDTGGRPDAGGPPPGLTALQTWMQHAIVSPRRPGAPAAGVLAGTFELSAEDRLGIYRHGYRRRLLEAMRALYPVLSSLLGSEVFEELALGHLEDRPSRSPNLAHLGDGFADHLWRRRPDPAARPEPWVRIIIDLARYERTFAEVYDGPGTEESGGGGSREPDRPEAPAHPGGTAPRFVACLRTLAVSAPVHRYHSAVRRGEPPPSLTPRPCHLVLSRRHYRVTCTELPAAEHRLLTSALTAASPWPAVARAAGLDPAGARCLLDRWSARGWLARTVTDTEPAPVPPVGTLPSAHPRK